jgi:hypothetical protein
MLQRIQTLFLLLVAILAIVLIFIPLGSFDVDALRLPLGILGLDVPEDTPLSFSRTWLGYVLPVLVLVIITLTLYSIFRYKRRRSQIQLGKLNILLHMGLVVAAFLNIDQYLHEFPTMSFRYGAGIFLPLASMVLILLANRAIKKDDELVRSADRIR